VSFVVKDIEGGSLPRPDSIGRKGIFAQRTYATSSIQEIKQRKKFKNTGS
jgi:hypothetical protein